MVVFFLILSVVVVLVVIIVPAQDEQNERGTIQINKIHIFTSFFQCKSDYLFILFRLYFLCVLNFFLSSDISFFLSCLFSTVNPFYTSLLMCWSIAVAPWWYCITLVRWGLDIEFGFISAKHFFFFVNVFVYFSYLELEVYCLVTLIFSIRKLAWNL